MAALNFPSSVTNLTLCIKWHSLSTFGVQRQSPPLGSSRKQNIPLPIVHLRILGSNSFPHSGATHWGPGSLEAVCQDREMDKPRASWVSLLLHRRNLAGGRTLVPSPPGETMSPPPRLSSTLPATEKFYFNHSTLVQYSILSASEMLQTKIGFHLSRPGNWILAGRSEFLHDIANGRQNPKQTCLQPPPVPDSTRQSVYSHVLYKRKDHRIRINVG